MMEPKDKYNLNTGPDNEIDLESIRKASGKARFYNQVILWVVVFVILFGAGCGAYLYYFITMSEKRAPQVPEPVPASPVKRPPAPETPPETPAQPKVSAAPAAVTKTPEPAPARPVREKPPVRPPAAPSKAPRAVAPAAVPTAEIALKKTDEAALMSTAEISLPAATGEVALPAPGTVEVSSAPATSENLAQKPADPKPAYATADTAEVQKLITSGRLEEAMTSAGEKLKTERLDPDVADRLRLMRSKISLFALGNMKEAHADFLKVKNPKTSITEYVSIYTRLFGASAPDRCRQLISSVLSDPKAELEDEEKIEIAKSALVAGLSKEAARALNNVVAVADFKAEIDPMRKAMAQEEAFSRSPGLNKYKNTVFSIEQTGELGGKKVVSIRNSEFFNAKSPVKIMFSSANAPGRIFACDSSDTMNEIDPVTGRLMASYPLSADGKISFAGCFEIFGASQVGMVRSGGKYQIATIRNSAFKKAFEPAYTGKADLLNPLAFSPSGKHAVRIAPTPGKAGECSMEVVSLQNGKTTAKTSGCLFRDADFSCVAFSAEAKKYDVDTVLESRYVYYFKYNPEPPSTAAAEFRHRFSLCVMNLETGDEKSLLNVRTNNPASLFISNLYPTGLMALSFDGSASCPGFAHMSGGTWISGRGFETATFLSQAVFRAFAANVAPGASKLNLFAAEFARPGIRMYEIEPRPLQEAAEYAKFLGGKNPKNALKLLKMFEDRNLALTQPEKNILAAEIKKFENEFEKLEYVRLLLEIRTLQRMRLEKTALERADAYIKPRRDGDAVLDDMLEVRAELDKAISNVK